MADVDAGREDSLPIAAELRIDQVCDRFEAAWKAGESPRIEAHLAGAAGAERSVLLAELVAVEIAYRRRQGERPGEGEYAARFPDDAELIHSVFEDPGRSESAPSRPAKPIVSSLPVTCPGGHAFRVKAEYAGRSGKCPYCDQTVHVPARAPSPQEVDTSVAAAGETIDWQPSDDVPASSARLHDGRLLEGQRIGRFELIEVLGKGAFGTVYRAYDPGLEREVALKVPRIGVFESEQELERFLREGRAAATLRHPNICPVYETASEGGHPYIAMAYIAGESLASLAAKGQPWDERRAAEVVRKLALALQEAHREGVIHRDLKPSNIMIDRQGEPVIMDFGLARRAGADDAQLTQSGQILGTPAYMPPEQACGELEAIGPASDVYSLGIILYQLLCGQRPFRGSTAHVVAQILSAQPDPPSTHRPSLDRRLETICLKAMAKAAEDRYRSMRELADALTEYLEKAGAHPARDDAGVVRADSPEAPGKEAGSVVSSAPARCAHGRRLLAHGKWPAAAAGAAVVLLLGVLLYVHTRYGTIKIEIADRDVEVFIDGDRVTIDRLGEPIELTVGEHQLVLERDGLVVHTQQFRVNRGENEALAVTWMPIERVATSKAGAWRAAPSLPTGRGLLDAAVLDGVIYVAGGSIRGSFYVKDLAALEAFDLKTQTWETKAPMPTARSMVELVAAGRFLYAIGGRTGPDGRVRQQNVVERYDPAANAWTRMSPMPTARNSHAAVQHRGKIYVIGGNDGRGKTAVVEVYDPLTDSWSRAADMPAPRQGIVAASLPDCVLVFGDDAAGSILAYVPATDQWTTRTPEIAVPFSHAAIASTDDTIYVFGGGEWSGGRFRAQAYEYNTSNNAFRRLPDLGVARGYLAGALGQGKVYAIGGFSNPAPAWQGTDAVECLCLEGQEESIADGITTPRAEKTDSDNAGTEQPYSRQQH